MSLNLKHHITLNLWTKLATACFVLFFVLHLTACDPTSWIPTAVSLINEIIPAVGLILGLVGELTGKGSVTETDAGIITQAGEAAVAALQNVVLPLISDYQAASAANQPGILGKIQAAVQAVEDNLTGILSTVHVEDPATAGKITEIVGEVEEAIAAVLSIIPVLEGKIALHDPSVSIPPNAKGFRKNFNGVMISKTGNEFLDEITPNYTLQH